MRLCFASFGFESLTDGFYSYQEPGTDVPPSLGFRGRRAEIMHNITCSLRTSSITGRILDNNNSPVNDALIRVAADVAGLKNKALGVALTDADGNYQVTGLPPGFLIVEAFKQGYYTQVSTGNVVHGASRATVNLAVKKAGPGRLTGIQNTSFAPLKKTRTNPDKSPRTVGGVFKSDDNTPIPNIPVMMYYLQSGANGARFVGFTTVTSDGTQRDNSGQIVPAGQYIFPQDIPIGDYQVVVNSTRVVNPATGLLEANTGQQSVIINGVSVTYPGS